MHKLLASAAVLLALSACAETAGQFRSEAGAEIDDGYFGNATLNNTLVQTGQREYAISLARRFASEVPSTVNFAFNSDVLGPEARAILDVQADWMRQFPELRFSVYGHTDLVGSPSYNQGLGERRARAVVAYLGARGIATSRLDALVSYGETQPLVLTENRERANRRTVTEVSGFVQRHPNVLNGKYAEVIFREYVTSATPARQLESIQGSEMAAGQ